MNDESVKDVSVIVIFDDELDVPMTKKPRRLLKNGHIVNNHESHILSSNDNKKYYEEENQKDQKLESDDELPIRQSEDDLTLLEDLNVAATDDYDYMDSFIDDGPLDDEDTETDSDNDD
ncbi:hypothetical protein Tco_0989304 [Tanacetum coccineum]|uniref:Uncharacterized protein n=1 Tax=Tanacetum coccineum TaxID=301880 RepID=A0ABQ5ETE1_9ASTR